MRPERGTEEREGKFRAECRTPSTHVPKNRRGMSLTLATAGGSGEVRRTRCGKDLGAAREELVKAAWIESTQ
jgi:hypothetical protein